MIQRHAIRLALAALTVAAAAAPAAAATDVCKQRMAPATLEIRQDNGYRTYFGIKQKGSQIWGYAKYSTTRRSVTGNFSGAISGDRFRVRVMWTYSGEPSIGVYLATINDDGYIFRGSTYDEYARPVATVGWHSVQKFGCKE